MITFNGKVYPGKTLQIKDGKVYIDGDEIDDDSKEINIVINGNIDTLEVDTCNKIEIEGSCNSLRNINGSVKVDGDVSGNVTTTNGSITCGNVGGSAKTTNGSISKK